MTGAGLIIFAHGSRLAVANDAVRNVAAEFARQGGYPLVEAAFLELAEPSLGVAAEALIAKGASRLIVIPYFLTLGTHMQRDLPALAADITAAHPDVRVDLQPPLDGHPALVEILLGRAAEALAVGAGRQ